MTKENKVQTIRVIQVDNGYIIVGPKSYIAKNKEEARELMNETFSDVLVEFEKPEELLKDQDPKKVVPIKNADVPGDLRSVGT